MSTLEKVFIKEFKRNIRSRGVTKNIYNIPLPFDVKLWKVSGSEVFMIKGVSDEAGGLYCSLNNTLASKVPQGFISARRKIDMVSKSFVKDDNGRYIYEDVKIPTGSIVVISKVQLNLPFGYKANEDGFGYIDFITNGVDREYLYYIPKKYVYLTHQTALALSVKNMKNYSGSGYVTWDSGVIYLHVIPYKPNAKYVGTKILKTGHTLNYSEEVKCIVDFWIKNNIVPDIVLCNTETEGNLVLKPTSVGYDTYNNVEDASLGDTDIYGDSLNDER